MRRNTISAQREGRRLRRQIRQALRADRKRRAEAVGSEAQAQATARQPKEAWKTKPYVSGRAIYAACVNSTRPAGTPTRLQFWWEQRDLPGQNGLQAEEHSDSEDE
jgi:hypothetical protein